MNLLADMNQSAQQNTRTPLVTVAIPTLNGADYLRETLMSLLAQDYPNLEILVSDNGSTDDSLALASAVVKGDPRVRFRRNETTVPIHEHYNQCLQTARGEFFSMLDDDDLITPNFVSELVGIAMRHPHIDFVMARGVTIDANGDIIQEYATPDAEVVDGFEFVCDWLYGRAAPKFPCIGTVLLRTATLRQFNGYQNFARGQNIDNLVLLQCALGNQIGFSHEAAFKWRVYDASYAGKISLQLLAQSSRQFVRHVRTDSQTAVALSKLSPAQRKEIIDGVGYMGASDVLYRMGFYQAPFSMAKLRSLFAFPLTSMCYRIIWRHYIGRLRDRFMFSGSTAGANRS
jgi:glycosyltransferase involved in cell wall biosynthesis